MDCIEVVAHVLRHQAQQDGRSYVICWYTQNEQEFCIIVQEEQSCAK